MWRARQRPGAVSGRAAEAIRSASETTPISTPAGSMIGTARTPAPCSRRASSANEASGEAVITSDAITSATVVRRIARPLRLRGRDGGLGGRHLPGERRLPHDRHRAARVEDAVQPYRPEQGTARRATAAVAEHEQISASGRVEEHGPRSAGGGLDRDRHHGELRAGATDLLELSAGRRPHLPFDL